MWEQLSHTQMKPSACVLYEGRDRELHRLPLKFPLPGIHRGDLITSHNPRILTIPLWVQISPKYWAT